MIRMNWTHYVTQHYKYRTNRELYTNRELQITSMTQGNNVTKKCSKNKTRGINAYAYGVLYYF